MDNIKAESDQQNPELDIYDKTFGLYQCVNDTFLATQCVPLIIYLLLAIIIEIYLGIYIFQIYKYKGKLLKKKNIILGCLFLGNLAYIVFNCSRDEWYIYFFQNYFMSMQQALVIYYFASKAFKIIENDNFKVFVKGIFAVIFIYDIGILVLNFVEYFTNTTGKVCKQIGYNLILLKQFTKYYYIFQKQAKSWTYIRAVEFFFSLVFACVGKYVIDKMEEQIKRISYPKDASETTDTTNIPAPILENIRQYKAKISQKNKIWILIIVNLIAGVTVNIKNVFILYNGRNDCRYIDHGEDENTNSNDIVETFLVFIAKVFIYYLPIIATLLVFRLREEDMKEFEQEIYYEEGLYTTALGMKRRGITEDENVRQKNLSDFTKSQLSITEPPSKVNQKNVKRNQQLTSINAQSKSINGVSPCSAEL